MMTATSPPMEAARMLTGPMTRMTATTLMESARPRVWANLKMAVRAWPAHCVRTAEFTGNRLVVRSGQEILYTDRRIINKEERNEYSMNPYASLPRHRVPEQCSQRGDFEYYDIADL